MLATRRRLTRRILEALPVPADGCRDYLVTVLRGFPVRIFASGRRSYRLKYSVGGRQRVATIGEHGTSWTAEQARQEAEDLRRVVDRGRDPIEERHLMETA